MLEIILIALLLFLILTFFYKQAICEFRINQIEWTQKEELGTLLSEKVPLVVRSLPPATFWTHEDALVRPCFQQIPIFQETTLTDWISTANAQSVCPWKYPQAETIAQAAGVPIWAQKWMNPVVVSPFMTWWLTPRYHCWAGNVGLRKTFATWTCLFPVDGALVVTIMPENVEASLPSAWAGCFPGQLTAKDTPFVGDLKFIDVILRPGSCLFLPAHWFVSWVSKEDSGSKVPMACTISYHTPISLLAFHASQRRGGGA
jgi:hypothetical protein